MHGYQLIEQEVQIVLVGSFNPAIFHPVWFQSKGLMTEQEVAAAELEVCHSDVTRFVAEWFQVEVIHARFTARTKHTGRLEDLRDFVASTFKILAETPVDAIGINKKSVFRCPDTKSWHALGDTLAPKDIWHEIFPESHVGMNRLELRTGRTDGLPGMYNTGVFAITGEDGVAKDHVGFSQNAHVEIKEAIKEEKVESLYDFLMSCFDAEVEFADKVFTHVLERV
ncbi:hypothetical protein CLH62_14265 [Marinobacter guineae]|uniref:TIGR04255 family protein n=1 Tax=Marinobacter guineae TaxID=432303 RepID=A0A2G1VFD8_9GAMM|nr:hypothetical protein [Marinobacter guineae]PHQ25483.1 hypothetical protein CLH62_14265 [Marinobacter guineae]